MNLLCLGRSKVFSSGYQETNILKPLELAMALHKKALVLGSLSQQMIRESFSPDDTILPFLMTLITAFSQHLCRKGVRPINGFQQILERTVIHHLHPGEPVGESVRVGRIEEGQIYIYILLFSTFKMLECTILSNNIKFKNKFSIKK